MVNTWPPRISTRFGTVALSLLCVQVLFSRAELAVPSLASPLFAGNATVRLSVSRLGNSAPYRRSGSGTAACSPERRGVRAATSATFLPPTPAAIRFQRSPERGLNAYAQNADLQGFLGNRRRLGCCLPCRRSRVRSLQQLTGQPRADGASPRLHVLPEIACFSGRRLRGPRRGRGTRGGSPC
jgi:hypothetical protein